MRFTRPRPGGAREESIEGSQTYLGRERRMLTLRGPIIAAPGRWDEFSVSFIMDDIIAMNVADPTRPIHLIIDSEGGILDDAMMLYDLIKISRAPIYTIVESAASAATLVGAVGKERLAFPHGRMMLHLPSVRFEGDSKLMEIRQKEMERQKDEMVQTYIECGVTAGLDKDMQDKDGIIWPSIQKKLISDIDRELWLTAEDGIKYGLVDRLITSEDIFGKEPVIADPTAF